MIYGMLADAPCYRGIHPRLDRVLDLLTPAYLSAIPAVRTELDGEALFVTRFDVVTSAGETRLFEYHHRYLDLFVTVQGKERVDIAAPDDIAVSEQSGDYWGGSGVPEQSVLLTPGRFLVLFPGDAHRPGMSVDGEPGNISRVVFKILL